MTSEDLKLDSKLGLAAWWPRGGRRITRIISILRRVVIIIDIIMIIIINPPAPSGPPGCGGKLRASSFKSSDVIQ